eukprot:506135_1
MSSPQTPLNTIQCDDLLVCGFLRIYIATKTRQIIPNCLIKLCFQHYHEILIELDPVPDINGYHQLIKINDYEFITVPEYHTPIKKSKRTDNILKYNTITNKWNDWHIHDNAQYVIDGHTACYDHIKKLLYIYTEQSYPEMDEIFIINAETHKYERVSIEERYDGNAFCVMVDGVLHLIGGQYNKWHKIWDYETKTMRNIFEFKLWEYGILDHVCVYVKGNNKINRTMILFGGYYQSSDPELHKKLCSIYNKVWYYSFVNRTWKCVENIELYFYVEAYVLTNNQRYIIIFWGSCIQILDLIDLPKISSTKIPSKWKGSTGCQAVMMPNDDIYIADCEQHHRVNVLDIIPSYQEQMWLFKTIE